MIKTKSIRMQEQLKAAYATKHKGVKRRARRDRIRFVDNLEHEAEQTASHGEMNTVYKITKQPCDKTTQPVRIKDTNDKPSDGFNTYRMSSTVLNHVNQLALILLRKTYILT